MTLTIKYFASLREQVQCAEELLDNAGVNTIADVRHALEAKHSEMNVTLQEALCAVNHQHIDDDSSLVRDGDEIAFFPPVTGG